MLFTVQLVASHRKGVVVVVRGVALFWQHVLSSLSFHLARDNSKLRHNIKLSRAELCHTNFSVKIFKSWIYLAIAFFNLLFLINSQRFDSQKHLFLINSQRFDSQKFTKNHKNHKNSQIVLIVANFCFLLRIFVNCCVFLCFFTFLNFFLRFFTF